MKCAKKDELEKAKAALTHATFELRDALKQPEQPISNSAIEALLGHETDQAIRDAYHNVNLTLIKTSQELAHHTMTCETCLQEE